ncbi:MAG: GAF domain-containing protein [Chloroflexi bacterium]|uniref:histidine kinase n=1 Tax=Candidatus Chlorohelix allophototropha TaxID=3003348 RepID=A0A8T7LZ83_9CHLR|nr:GAF domain-containing protein [Chloroflexota bacterium]WJW66721.1 ATP-binding protein [Chloroflexota bacterium L227-S17]
MSQNSGYNQSKDNASSLTNVAKFLKKDSQRILNEWWEAIKKESPSFAELEKLRNPELYHEQSLELIIKALMAYTRKEQDTLLDQVNRMAREMASERLRQGFQMKDLLMSLAVFRRAVLDSVQRMLQSRLWVAFPASVMQMEKRINEAMDIQVAAVAEAYMTARDSIIRHREETMRFHNYQLGKLNDLSNRIGQTLDMVKVMNSAAAALCEMAELSAGAVALHDQKAGHPLVHPDYGHHGCTNEIINWLNSSLFVEISGEIVERERPLVVMSVADDARFSNAVAFGVSSLLCIPLKSADKIVGVMYGVDYIVRDFSPHEVNLLLTFANQAALAIENARLYTEVQIAYVELKELDRVKDEFVSIASHEIRTPLALIKGYASTLLRAEQLKLSPEKEQRFINGIDEASNRLITLIDNLLSVSRIESGRFRINPQPVNAREAINHAVSTFQGQLGNHELELDLVHDEARARCNRDQFEQVIINLVSNAIKYSPEGAKISISTRRIDNGEKVEIRVSDQGSGIAQEHLMRIFEKFYRVETGLTRKTQGTGLGLYICKNIITSYGGEIWAESAVGQGTTFVITLQVWKVDAE